MSFTKLQRSTSILTRSSAKKTQTSSESNELQKAKGTKMVSMTRKAGKASPKSEPSK